MTGEVSVQREVLLVEGAADVVLSLQDLLASRVSRQLKAEEPGLSSVHLED